MVAIKSTVVINKYMRLSLEQFVKKYKIDDFTVPLELSSQEKINFYNDFINIFKAICRIFDKLTNIASLRGGQVLMSLAKLEKTEAIINKTDVKKSLNIDRLEKLIHSFEYLEKMNYIKIEKKTSKFHIVKLNEEDNPDFTLFKEIVQNFWETPEEEAKKVKKWGILK